MQIFAFEYITGGGLIGKPLPEGMRQEGDMMLHALVTDLAELPEVEVVTLRDGRLPDPELPAEVQYIENWEGFTAAWDECVRGSDAVWPIAPETDGILEDVSKRVLEAGIHLLGSRTAALRLAASKQATAEVLIDKGLPALAAGALDSIRWESGQSWVVKPDDGVGCVGVRALKTPGELERLRAELDPGRNYVAQPFLGGTPISLCVLCCEGRARLLSTNLQRIAMTNDEFALLGCTVNARNIQQAGYEALADSIAAAVPELWGLVGVDLIATPEGPQVLEINPRLTTSYVGLRRSIGVNPAELVLALNETGVLPATAFSGVPVEVPLEVCHVA